MTTPSTASGVLVVDKPAGISSFAVVRCARRAFGGAKVGHTGTLDPLATGVLPLCIGEATKIAGLLLAGDKVYRAEAQLGLVSDTGDSTGSVTPGPDPGRVATIDPATIERALSRFRGTISQIPPAYSALRQGGRRAYQLARAGEAVVLDPRTVTLHELRLERWSPPHLELWLRCSKGTYVRSLVADLGAALGCGALLTALRREVSGAFSLAQAVPLTAIDEATRDGLPLLDLDAALPHLPALALAPEELQRLRWGQVVASTAPAADPVRLHFAGSLVALGAVAEGALRVRRLLSAAWSVPGLRATRAEAP
ncbi:MAG: tRNA pseudouridine(55) synthase TruB [Proteobacteria bacterium]|nr:tRNA pseudouridine(55) synthase TruB [Pseudomonadota bacterium]